MVGVEEMKLAVMGLFCGNGPGESKHAKHRASPCRARSRRPKAPVLCGWTTVSPRDERATVSSRMEFIEILDELCGLALRGARSRQRLEGA